VHRSVGGDVLNNTRPVLEALPPHSLLADYAAAGAYTDCFALDVAGSVSVAQFIAAFYTSRLFKKERWILKWVVSKPSTDDQAKQLAAGKLDRFAAWTVERRTDTQFLACDYQGRTRSWLMVTPNGDTTKLSFGTAVVAQPPAGSALGKAPLLFRALVGPHRLYAQALLRSAVRQLEVRP
jgi:hypothetical protein